MRRCRGNQDGEGIGRHPNPLALVVPISRSMVCHRHVVAAIRALSAGSGALLHVLILAPADLLATAGTTIADLSTNATHVGVKIGTAKHEIGGSTADLSAVLQQSDMVCVSVQSGLLQAILNGFCAHCVTTGALVDTRLKMCLRYHMSLLWEFLGMLMHSRCRK